METIAINVFKFEELSPEVQASIIESEREYQVYDDWHDYVLHNFTIICKSFGLTVSDMQFRGFWSQGDGASFIGGYEYKKGWRKELLNCTNNHEILELAEQLQAVQKKYFYKLQCNLYRSNSLYCHSATMHSNIQHVDDYEITDCNVEAEINDIFRALADELYSMLETEYEYLISDEVVIESLIGQGLDYMSDGTVI